jgi:hypothetical protein
MAYTQESGADTKKDANQEAENPEQGRVEEPQKVDEKKAVPSGNVLGQKGKIFISAGGGCGITYPFAELHGTGDQSLSAGFSYTAGIKTGLFLFDYGALVLGVDYAGKDFSINRKYLGLPWKTSYSFSFVDLSLGFQGHYRFFYAELGVFGGLKVGEWKEANKLAGLKYSLTSLDKWRHNEVGLYIGAGFLIRLIEDLSFDIGVKYKISFLYAYENVNKYKTTQALVTVGIIYRFRKKLF